MSKASQFFHKLFPQNRRSWIIYLFCVATAALFWLFLTFNRSFESVLSFNLTYENLPDDLVLVNQPVGEIDVRVKARGFDLLTYTLLEKRKHISLDVQQFSKLNRGSKTKFFLELTGNPYQILQNRNPMSVISYSVDSLILRFDERLQKDVPVNHHLKLNYDSTFYKVKIKQFSPDSVRISGSKSVVRKLESASLIDGSTEEVNRSGIYRLAVSPLAGLTQLIPDSVSVEVELIPFKDFEISIPIKCVGKPEDVEVKFFPASAAVKFSCTEDVFKNLDPKQFKLIADYGSLTGESQRVLLRLMKYPEYLKNIKVSPGKAEYLVRKKGQ